MSYYKNIAIRAKLFMRGWGHRLTFSSRRPKNIYHACIQKTGSQWIKAVFSDPEIVKRTGLQVHPQFRYEVGEFRQKFPLHTFIAGLYIPYPMYNEIDKPKGYKTLYVVRDPRDIVVSWYYSMKYTHGEMGAVSNHRKILRGLSEKRGLEYCINHLQWKFSFIRTWWYNRNDPDIYLVRFEDLTNDPISEWGKIFNHCEIEIEKNTLEKVLSKYTKEKMRERDLKNRDGDISHYRKEKKGWRDLFNKNLIEIFQKNNGNLIELLGYE